MHITHVARSTVNSATQFQDFQFNLSFSIIEHFLSSRKIGNIVDMCNFDFILKIFIKR